MAFLFRSEPELDKFCRRLRKNDPKLTYLNLYGKNIDDDRATVLAQALETNTTLQTLHLHSNNIGDDGAKALAKALETNTTLRTLDLNCNKIGADGAKALAKALETNKTLQTLYLWSNKIGADGAKALAKALETNTTLQTLKLDNNNVGADGAKALAKALETNTTLQTLYLYSNNIGADGAKALAKALETNTTLQTLNLWSNNIGADGAKALAKALETNTTLQTLNLLDNNIGDDGAKALAKALETNTTLQGLDLRYNKIGADGAKALAKALETNTTLQTLKLDSNNIGADGAKALLETLNAHNGTLTCLDLDGNSIPNEFLQEIRALEKANEYGNRSPTPIPKTKQSEPPATIATKPPDPFSLFSGTQSRVDPPLSQSSVPVIIDAHHGETSVGWTKDTGIESSTSAEENEPSPLELVASGKQRTPVAVPIEYIKRILTEEEIGRGFFGIVLKGYDPVLQQAFAVKTNHVNLEFQSPEQLRRLRKSFQTELKVSIGQSPVWRAVFGVTNLTSTILSRTFSLIQTLYKFRHPNIVSLYGYFMTEDLLGKQYLIYELAENGPLSEFWKSEVGRDRLSSFQRRVQIAVEVFSAIRFLHVGNDDIKHCFHRDIKPYNVVLKSDMTAKLIDCGLAKLVPKKGAANMSSVASGSDAYMCPQYQRRTLNEYKAQCDIFSFGIVMTELWTGHLQSYKNDETDVAADYFQKYAMMKSDIVQDVDDALDIKGYDKLPDYSIDFARLAVKCMSYELKDRPTGPSILSELQEIYRKCEADTKDDSDVEARQEVEAPSITSQKTQCRLCRRENVRCFPEPSGYRCFFCLLYKFKREIIMEIRENRGEIRENRSEIIDARVDNRQLHNQMLAAIGSLAEVLSSLDARLVNQIPCLFLLIPAEKAKLREHPRSWLRSLGRRTYRIYFVCAHSYQKVESWLEFRVSKHWIKQIAPLYAVSLYALQAALHAFSGIDFGLDAMANNVFREYGARDLDAILGTMKEVLLEEPDKNAGLLESLNSRKLDSSQIRRLDNDTVKPVVELALSQRKWHSEMKHVRRLDDARTQWVLNKYARQEYGYTTIV